MKWVTQMKWVTLLVILILIIAIPMATSSMDNMKEHEDRHMGDMDFIHGIVINVDGVDYYLAGAPDGPNGEFDIPGHSWLMTGPNKLMGKHYNTGPFGAPQWWSSDADNATLLYTVKGIIDTWSEEKAGMYAKRGFVHYHELINVSNTSEMHPTKVVWLKHTAQTSFTLDGGPHPMMPGLMVTPGVDYLFIPNYFMPYMP
ncbi:MAG: hypothetical protein M8353_03345 [ANME-2 cluster archaeon]|nr:hypothetical protein [ANME-2 cluster archaeon]